MDSHTNEYPKSDDFIEDDDDDALIETDNESQEYFEPVRVKGKTRSTAKRPLGPPITIDDKIERLNDVHQAVVEDFLYTAKQQSQKASCRVPPESIG